MANADASVELIELLQEILVSLKRHAQAIFDLTGDAEGLKRSVDDHEKKKRIDKEREKALDECRLAFHRELGSYDAMLARLDEMLRRARRQ